MAEKNENKLVELISEPEKLGSVKTLTVTLVKSPIRSRAVAKSTIKSLGLRRMHQSHTLPDNEAIRGMIHAVRGWVKVEE